MEFEESSLLRRRLRSSRKIVAGLSRDWAGVKNLFMGFFGAILLLQEAEGAPEQGP